MNFLLSHTHTHAFGHIETVLSEWSFIQMLWIAAVMGTLSATAVSCSFLPLVPCLNFYLWSFVALRIWLRKCGHEHSISIFPIHRKSNIYVYAIIFTFVLWGFRLFSQMSIQFFFCSTPSADYSQKFRYPSICVCRVFSTFDPCKLSTQFFEFFVHFDQFVAFAVHAYRLSFVLSFRFFASTSYVWDIYGFVDILEFDVSMLNTHQSHHLLGLCQRL